MKRTRPEESCTGYYGPPWARPDPGGEWAGVPVEHWGWGCGSHWSQLQGPEAGALEKKAGFHSCPF